MGMEFKMGMYDVISDRLYCPFCGKLQEENDFQTKDLSSSLDRWSLEEIENIFDYHKVTGIHHKCRSCGKWININFETKKNDKMIHEKSNENKAS